MFHFLPKQTNKQKKKRKQKKISTFVKVLNIQQEKQIFFEGYTKINWEGIVNFINSFGVIWLSNDENEPRLIDSLNCSLLRWIASTDSFSGREPLSASWNESLISSVADLITSSPSLSWTSSKTVLPNAAKWVIVHNDSSPYREVISKRRNFAHVGLGRTKCCVRWLGLARPSRTRVHESTPRLCVPANTEKSFADEERYSELESSIDSTIIPLENVRMEFINKKKRKEKKLLPKELLNANTILKQQ